jgi:hypothetical protein
MVKTMSVVVLLWKFAGVVKRSNTTDCKSVGIRLRRFESYPQYHMKKRSSKAISFSLAGISFELYSWPTPINRSALSNDTRSISLPKERLHLGITEAICYNYPKYAAIAQPVERIHGKDEVSGSNPDRGSMMLSLVILPVLC